MTSAGWSGPADLGLTGERTLPGIWHENYWFRRHEAAYLWVAQHVAVAGRTVVDAGAGEGYGAALLSAAGAVLVVGVDLDEATVRHVRATHPGVRPVRANLDRLPCRTGSVGVVVSSQVVEHLWDQHGFVRECARVLEPGGRLVLTTPNRRTFPRGNPFHHRELDTDELTALVAGELSVEDVLGFRHGPRLAAVERAQGDLVAALIATEPGAWDQELRAAVTGVTAADFAVGDPGGSLDLLVVGVRR